MDNQPPVLLSLSFPGTISVSGTDTTRFELTAAASDTGTGVDQVRVQLDRSLSADGRPTSINIANGTGVALLTSATNAGTYHIASVSVVDRSNNVAAYTPAQLQALGIATSFTVNSPTPDDSNPPVLTGLTLADIDVRAGSTYTNMMAAANDAGSGAYKLDLTFDRGFGTYFLYFNGNPPGQLRFYLDKNLATGTVHVLNATLYDKAGNGTSYTASQLQALGFDSDFIITGNSAADATAPVLTSLTIPKTIDVSHGTANVAIAAGITEDGSGIAAISLKLSSVVSVAYPYQYSFHGPRFAGPARTFEITAYSPAHGFYGSSLEYTASGNDYKFVYPGGTTIPIGPATPGGTYHVVGATVTDNAGNSSTYTEAQLQALGISTTFAVVADGTAPVLTSLTLPDFSANTAVKGTFLIAGTDQESGLDSAVIHLDRPFSGSTALTFIPGSFVDNVGGLQTYYGEPRGAFTVRDVVITDAAGNSSTYTTDQLSMMGLKTSFVVKPEIPADFDGEGRSDLLWINVNGAVSTWSKAAGQVDLTKDTYDSRVDRSWSVAETLDWNGDGNADILWRNANGDLSIWTGATGSFQQSAFNDASVSSAWTVAAAGDFNGDAKDDILWRRSDGALSAWASTGSDFQRNSYFHNPVDTAWKVEGVGDFNGDNKADILWRNDNGALAVWNSTGSAFQESSIVHDAIDRAWHVVGVGDFNGDGKADILWRNDNGAVSAWLGGANGFVENSMNGYAAPGWSVATVGNFEYGGSSEIFWRNDASGAVSLWRPDGDHWQQNIYFDSGPGLSWTVAAHHFLL